MRAPAIPRGVARRIDRLARAAHAFHRFAHHPLCSEYAGEVVRVGRRARICRGCASSAAGALAGFAFGVARAPSPAIAAALAALAVVLFLASRRTRRLGKTGGRLLPAALLSFAATAGLAPAAVAIGAGALVVRSFRRRGPYRGPCAACPERAGPAPCRGFAAIVRRERAFRRAADRMLEFERAVP